MSDEELEQLILKARRFKQLRRARERVKRLEGELRANLCDLRILLVCPNSSACR
jgi:hypothetical protein